MKELTAISFVTAAALFLMGENALAREGQPNPASYTIGVSGVTPVICHVSIDAATAQPSGATISLGSLREFCNSPNGYQVVVDYSANLAGGKLVIDGVPASLGVSGSRVVSRSENASMATHLLDLVLPAGVASGSISFRIEPL